MTNFFPNHPKQENTNNLPNKLGESTAIPEKEDPRDKRPTEIEKIDDEDSDNQQKIPPIGDKPTEQPLPQPQAKTTFMFR